jgi:hypothetical protein
MEFRNRGAACRREADKPLSAALLRPLTQPGNCIEIACLPGESRFTAACPILVGLHHATRYEYTTILPERSTIRRAKSCSHIRQRWICGARPEKRFRMNVQF